MGNHSNRTLKPAEIGWIAAGSLLLVMITAGLMLVAAFFLGPWNSAALAYWIQTPVGVLIIFGLTAGLTRWITRRLNFAFQNNQTDRVKRWISSAGGVLMVAGLLLCLSANTIDKTAHGQGGKVIMLVIAMFASAQILWKWSERDFRFDADAVPMPMKIIGGYLLIFMVVFLNLLVCRWRLDNPSMNFRFISTLTVHIFIWLAGGGIHLISYPRAPLKEFGIGRILCPVLLSGLAVVLLNFAFHVHVGDLTTHSQATQTCYPGGGCYDSGEQQWGGMGTTFLMGINFLQGLLILNALYGLYLLKCRLRK